jgi:hypothetical protein
MSSGTQMPQVEIVQANAELEMSEGSELEMSEGSALQVNKEFEV